jgi:LytR cell envelope-related transcriptional attenuator
MDARKAWLALKTPVTMLVLLAFVLLVGAWGFKQTVTPVPKAPPTPCVVKTIGPKYTSDNAWIRIYNGTTVSGLAKNVVKLVFGNAGFHVYKVANADAPIPKTFVSGASVTSPEVVLVMSYLPAGTPFVADPVKYADHIVDLNLGADFKATNISATPLTEVELKDGTACVPVIQPVSPGS